MTLFGLGDIFQPSFASFVSFCLVEGLLNTTVMGKYRIACTDIARRISAVIHSQDKILMQRREGKAHV